MTELAEIEGAEDQLLALASQLDEPVENTDYTLHERSGVRELE